MVTTRHVCSVCGYIVEIGDVIDELHTLTGNGLVCHDASVRKTDDWADDNRRMCELLHRSRRDHQS